MSRKLENFLQIAVWCVTIIFVGKYVHDSAVAAFIGILVGAICVELTYIPCTKDKVKSEDVDEFRTTVQDTHNNCVKSHVDVIEDDERDKYVEDWR